MFRCVPADFFFFWRMGYGLFQVILPHHVIYQTVTALCMSKPSQCGGAFLDGALSCGRSLCGSVYVQNVNNLRAEQLSACTRFLFFFVFLQGVKLVRFEGCGVCAVTQGEREAFSWTHFMDVLGSSDGNGGGQAAHSFLWGPCGVRAKNRRRRACNSTECLQPRLILTQVETSSATLLLLQVDSRPLTEASAPMRHPKGDKKKRNENYKLLPTLRLIFTNYTYSKSKC